MKFHFRDQKNVYQDFPEIKKNTIGEENIKEKDIFFTYYLEPKPANN
jgi:hypothetical protein